MYRILSVVVVLVWTFSPAAAQLVSIKTVPVASGDQFLLFPSQNLGMGGVSIALEDPLLDPFTNPAKGARLEGARFMTMPQYYGVSMDGFGTGDQGSAKSIPVGVLASHGGLFGGMLLAWQELTVQQQGVSIINDFLPTATVQTTVQYDGALSRSNRYGFALAGLQLPQSNVSLGVSVFAAGLRALEGVRLLYWQGDRVQQEGNLYAVRLGLLAALDERRTAEVLLMHHRLDMTHTFAAGVGDARIEEDQTDGWAVQVGYVQALAEGWRLGGQVTGDWQWHPKIPNYDLMQIPRDPGNSSAYNIGIGLVRQRGQATFGLDAIYEPIRSHTWADALEDTPTAVDGLIRAGEKTVDNQFQFDNTIVRAGVRHEGEQFDFQLGLHLHTIRYHLAQQDFVGVFERDLDERWNEWTFSVGFGYAFPGFQVRYVGLLTLGTGRPGVEATWGLRQAFAGAMDTNVLLAPGGPLTLQEARVFTHQVTLLVPLTE